jgi:hypothetical protein
MRECAPPSSHHLQKVSPLHQISSQPPGKRSRQSYCNHGGISLVNSEAAIKCLMRGYRTSEALLHVSGNAA